MIPRPVARLLREPLLHFLVLGALLFALYGGVNRDGLRSPEEVVVDQSRVDALAAQFQRVWQRAPTRDELQGLVDTWVREEIVYREGVATGMERDDEVVRRRVVQKMDFMTEGMASDVPKQSELQAWLREHPDDYRIAPRYTLLQVYFDPARHGERLDRDIGAALKALQRDPRAPVGDLTMLPATMADASADEVARAFGQPFTDALDELPLRRWSGPLVSGFGLHLVRIDARNPGRTPSLAEVRKDVERDLLNARSRQAREDAYNALRRRYAVRVEADLDRARIAASAGAASSGAGAQ